MTPYFPTLPDPLRLPGTPPPVCRRGPRDPHFTGRDDELERVSELLCEERVLVVDGDGLEQSGKSAFALEYCHRFGQRYNMIWWFDCRAEDGLDAQEDAFREQAGDALRSQRWRLSVYDGVRSAADVDGHLPGGPAHVLLTSHGAHRPHDRGVPDVRTFPLGALTREESIMLLMRKAPALDPAQARRLAEAVCHWPALLGELGDRLVERPDLDVDTCLGLIGLGRRVHSLASAVPAPRLPPMEEPATVGEPLPAGEPPPVEAPPSPSRKKVPMALVAQLVNAMAEVRALNHDGIGLWIEVIEDRFEPLDVQRDGMRATLVRMTNRALAHENGQMLEGMLEALGVVAPANEPGVPQVAEIIGQIKRIRYP
ncbi:MULTISPECIES: hypothetical protein [unclassified Actinomadura]|uniref:hypothetical protein n=1 Tax=unclassified Actinomadura TaxID=2626254 RepID=UPI0011F038B5|nr:hypothetical protein [Actinomadura sp. K4S16]